jgi:orotate phosphoribosyltransferase
VKAALLEIVERRGHLVLDQPVELRSGGRSRHFVDGKRALARGDDLRLAATSLLHLLRDERVTFDVVGGLTMGADHLAHASALGAGRRAVVLEDVVTTGASVLEAVEAVRATGAEVVFATSFVDRGDQGAGALAAAGVPYRALLTYLDLAIPAVGSE